MKTTIWFDQSKYDNTVRELEHAREAYQTFFNDFTALALFKPSTIQEINDILTGGAGHVRGKLEDLITPPTFGIFKISKKKAVDLLDIDLSVLHEMVKPALAQLGRSQYLILSGDTIQVTRDLSKLKEDCSIIASSRAQQDLWNAQLGAAKALSKLNAALKGMNAQMSADTKLRELFTVGDQGQVEQNIWFFERRRYEFSQL